MLLGFRTRPPDEGWLEELFRQHADAVLTFLRHRTDHETAQDVLAETFTIAWRRKTDVPADPRGWLYGVARRVLANHRRSQGRTEAVVERMLTENRFEPGDAGIDDAIERHDTLRALAGLSEPDREVLLLTGWYDLTAAQAAQALGCSQAAYAVRLHRARKRLRAALNPITPGGALAGRPAWETNS